MKHSWLVVVGMAAVPQAHGQPSSEGGVLHRLELARHLPGSRIQLVSFPTTFWLLPHLCFRRMAPWDELMNTDRCPIIDCLLLPPCLCRYNWGDCRVERSSSGLIGHRWRRMMSQPGVALNAMSRHDLYRALHVDVLLLNTTH